MTDTTAAALLDDEPLMDTQPAPATSAGADAVSDTEVVRRLADILNDTGLTSIELERGGLKIRVAREATLQAAAPVYAQAAPAAIAAPAPAPAQAITSSAAAASASSASPAPAEGDLVKSPMVGTIYLQPQPGAAPFARAGDTVAAGQTLFVVEAMKTMNPIPAPRAGKLVEILVGDAQPVEFGQPLAVIA